MGRIAHNDARNLLTTLENFEPRLPGRLVEGQAGETRVSGERRLMVALLADALGDFQKYVVPHTRREARRFAESADWLFGDMNGAAVTFEYVCDVLGLNASTFQAELKRWRDRQRPQAGCGCKPVRKAPVPRPIRPVRRPTVQRSDRWKRLLPTAWPPSAEAAVAS